MCEECARLRGAVVKLWREYEYAERYPDDDDDLLGGVDRDLREAWGDLKAHTDSCPDCEDPWAEHQAAAAAGQTDLLGGGA